MGLSAFCTAVSAFAPEFALRGVETRFRMLHDEGRVAVRFARGKLRRTVYFTDEDAEACAYTDQLTGALLREFDALLAYEASLRLDPMRFGRPWQRRAKAGRRRFGASLPT